VLTASDLIAFERDIADAFNAGQIRAPVHLSGGGEETLIEIFREVGPRDWVLTTWRSHYHALLRGVPPAQLKADILAGRSITLCYPEHRVLSSAIVGGILPIAVGIAWAIRRANLPERVWAFVGDMTSMTGVFTECAKYARGHDLPIRLVVEDNGRSVCTPTQEVWGSERRKNEGKTRHYRYESSWPHSGAGVRVNF
jgi:TPP-dependent pyruvate/acetoin dehydrogenase alpha subunit